jgi:hypothetical protein
LASRGSETQTTVPTPSVERSFIEPPCRLAGDFAIASPRLRRDADARIGDQQHHHVSPPAAN